MRRAIEWLGGNHGEARRYAAALVARELAENAPAVFNVHVRAFIDAIWAGLRDQRLLVRDASVAALRVRNPQSYTTLPYHGRVDQGHRRAPSRARKSTRWKPCMAVLGAAAPPLVAGEPGG